MQRETNRQKITDLKLRMYSYAPPPFFCEAGRQPPCNTVTPYTNYNISYTVQQSEFPILI